MMMITNGFTIPLRFKKVKNTLLKLNLPALNKNKRKRKVKEDVMFRESFSATADVEQMLTDRSVRGKFPHRL